MHMNGAAGKTINKCRIIVTVVDIGVGVRSLLFSLSFSVRLWDAHRMMQKR